MAVDMGRVDPDELQVVAGGEPKSMSNVVAENLHKAVSGLAKRCNETGSKHLKLKIQLQCIAGQLLHCKLLDTLPGCGWGESQCTQYRWCSHDTHGRLGCRGAQQVWRKMAPSFA